MQRRTILFYDPVCPVSYDPRGLLNNVSAVGGTEATVVRIAEALGRTHTVVVAQHNRSEPYVSHNASYVPFDGIDQLKPDAVVALRSYKTQTIRSLRRSFRAAKLCVWFHDWFWPRHGIMKSVKTYLSMKSRVRALRQANATLIFVSRSHLDNAVSFWKRHLPLTFTVNRLHLEYVYNPVDIPTTPWDRVEPEVDINKLVFFSAPYKGLRTVLETFERISHAFPDLKLYVAAPSYAGLNADAPLTSQSRNVINLGSLSHQEVIAHLRTALCYFYPANVWPETFGLVFVESNAVGTPVLAHPFGSAPEVLSEEQLCDATDFDQIINRLDRWRTPGGRPKVLLQERFRIGAVIDRWNQVLFGSATE